MVVSVRVTISSGRLFQRFIELGKKEPKRGGDLWLIGLILHELSQCKDYIKRIKEQRWP